jgi:hypothetical protein
MTKDRRAKARRSYYSETIANTNKKNKAIQTVNSMIVFQDIFSSLHIFQKIAIPSAKITNPTIIHRIIYTSEILFPFWAKCRLCFAMLY